MRVFTNNTFKGLYIGGSAVVVARGPKEAAKRLQEELAQRHIEESIKPEEMVEVDTSKISVTILDDGDY